MSELRSFKVTSTEDAKQALDYFNAFHDGWIKRMIITSCDELNDDGHVCTGLFHVVMDVIHNNYPGTASPIRPYGQLVQLEFHNVQDIFCDLSAAYVGNTIMSFTIHAANRRRGDINPVEVCLALRLARQYYYRDQRLHELRESQMFTFSDATFGERAGPER